MNINKLSFLLVAVLLIFGSCADDDLSPIVTFDSAGKGAYPRLIEEGDKLINLFDIDGSSYTYTVEFVDEQQGSLVSEYVLDLDYNGTGAKEFKRWPASAFSTNGGGYQQAPSITITANEAIAAAGLTADDVNPGDEFTFRGRVILQDGSEFTSSNSSATVRGAAFRGHFDFTLGAGCPSFLAGSYNYTTTALWCGADDVSGSVDFVDVGGGSYEFSDASFGGYGACYNCCAATGLTFIDVCEEVSFTSFVNQYGDTFTMSSEVDGEDWIITWENDYGEAGVTTVNFPGGVPFTVN